MTADHSLWVLRLAFSLKSGFAANQTLIIVVWDEAYFRHLKYLFGSPPVV